MELLPELLTASEVASACRVHVSTVARWAREGRLNRVRLPGGRIRFRRQDVDELFAPQP